MPLVLYDHADLEPSERDDLAASVAGLTSLERVLHWARALTPPSGVEEIITQDEFTHDVVVPVAGRYLVFDTT